MNLDALEKKLLAAARCHPPSEQVPYAFEQRIMARLRGATPLDAWTLWGQALWRAAVTCLVVMLLFSGLTMWSTQRSSSNGDFSRDFEIAVFASADQIDESE